VTIHWTGRPEADALLDSDPLALLIGMLLDQQVKMEKAFSGPYDLRQRLGGGPLDAAAIAAMDPDRLDQVFRERPALHRFPGNMARRVQQVCAAVAQDYGNDAAAIWRDVPSGEELARRLRALPGFGEGKTRIMVSVLARRFDIRPPGWEAEAAHWHSIADVDSPETMAEAREVKRAMKKDAGA
jgi:uncharacterized HhH-GPD family protein